MAELHLTFLGGIGATKDGSTAVHFGSRKAQALLCYLAVNRQTFTREALAGLLWSEMPEANARMNLRRTLYRLRPLLDPYLQISSQDVAFNYDLPYWLDVEQFETAVSLPNRNHTRLQEAVDLYRGDFLDGFHVKKAPAFEEWMLVQRVRLRDLVVQTLQTLVGDCLKNEAYHEGINYANRLLALDPWREDAHRQLMMLLACSGQRSAALLQYDSCRCILAEELGVDPSPATMVLHQQILDNAFDVTLPLSPVEPIVVQASAVPITLAKKPVPHNWQRPLIPLLGRKEELALLAQLLADPAAQAITILGPGGMGKTRLALEAAEAALARHDGQDVFQHGIYVVSLAQLSSAVEILPAIAEALNFNFYEYGQPEEQLLSYLRGKQMLLILDNFEHVTEGAALVEKILRTSPGIKIIVTSREKLNRQWEYLFHLSGMDFPASRLDTTVASKIDHAANFGAVQLFLKTAQRARPSFSPSPADMGHVVHICHLVQGMPLGIILAAGWLEILLPHEIAAGIKQGLDFLETELKDVPQRQRSLRAVFDYSWRLLTESERMVFQQLSVFRGGFTYDSAGAVTGATLHDLRTLAGKSLLQREVNGRYQIHELLRQFGAEKLAEDVEKETAVRDQHAAYYCEALQQRLVRLQGNDNMAALAEIEVDSQNMRAAWEWAVRQRQFDRLIKAIDSLGCFYRWQGYYNVGEQIFQRAIEQLADDSDTASLRVKISILTWHGHFLYVLGQLERAEQQLQQALTLLEQSDLTSEGMQQVRALALTNWGRLKFGQGHNESAQIFFEQSLALCQAVNNRFALASNLIDLAKVSRQLSNYEEARQNLQAGLSIYQSLGYERGVADALEWLSLIARYQGQIEESERLALECLAVYERLGRLPDLARGQSNLGIALSWAGKDEQAEAWLLKSVEIFTEIGDVEWLLSTHTRLGFVQDALDKPVQARQTLEAGLRMARQSGLSEDIGFALWALGRLAIVEGKYAEAEQHLTDSITLFKQLHQTGYVGRVCATLAKCHVDAVRKGQAQRFLCQALQLGIDVSDFLPVLTAVAVIAHIFAQEGQVERAIELHGLCSTERVYRTSGGYFGKLREPLTAIADSLPSEIAEAAQKRGRKLDWWQAAESLLADLQELGWHEMGG